MLLVGMPKKLSEEIKYLYFETIYSNPQLVIDVEALDQWIDLINCIQSQNGLIV